MIMIMTATMMMDGGDDDDDDGDGDGERGEQDDVVRVVNLVARHVHEAVLEGFGAPNKNMVNPSP